jgi:type II secretory pathway pseudopilin PulG
MKTHDNHFSRKLAGFSLVEIIAVCTIIGIMAGIMIFPVLGMIDNARKRAERVKLAKIADEIRASFTVDNLVNNISALPGELPIVTASGAPAVPPTLFDHATRLNLSAATVHDWYMKLAHLRGQGASSTATAEGTEANAIAVNPWKGRRVLFVGPNENYVQRYVLLSFMFPEEDTPAVGAPASDTYDSYVAWFDRIYDHDWGSPLAMTPAGAEPSWGNWAGTSLRGQNFAERVAVEKIVQRRYCIQVNNNTRDLMDNPIDMVKIYTNVPDGWDWSAPGAVEAGRYYPFDGETATWPSASTRWSGNTREKDPGHWVGILAGRRVFITRQNKGKSTPEEQMYSLLLNEDVQVTVQNPRFE